MGATARQNSQLPKNRKRVKNMACRKMYAYQNRTSPTSIEFGSSDEFSKKTLNLHKLLFGVDSKTSSTRILQNHLTEFEWVKRNKLPPNFWGRYLTGDDCLTHEEIRFLHMQGCKIAPLYIDKSTKKTESQGKQTASAVATQARYLNIPCNTVIFLEISERESISTSYMKGFISGMLEYGYIPGWKANTDAMFGFDKEFSRGMQTDTELFRQSQIWATAPTIKEYDEITTSHLIHPDYWKPYAPSGITRNEIAVWQYGQKCHQIFDDENNKTYFNIDLIQNMNMFKSMF